MDDQQIVIAIVVPIFVAMMIGISALLAYSSLKARRQNSTTNVGVSTAA
jgi:hypothetical protein